MTATQQKRATWHELMASGKLQLLPTAHDALAAKLIEKAGYTSYQIGMFAVVGARFGFPDIDLAQFGENSQSAREIIEASNLPVLVDCAALVEALDHLIDGRQRLALIRLCHRTSPPSFDRSRLRRRAGPR